MSTAGFTFLSWLRRGSATGIEVPDEAGASVQRVAVPVAVRFNQDLEAEVQLALNGPGDVAGFDPRVVVRRWPLPNSTEAEPNLFPVVEFDQPDFPWRYTPARASAKDRLRPWLCLLALAEEEIESFDAPVGERRLAALRIRAGTPLPLAEQVWPWAHVQASGTMTADAAALAALLATEPHRVVARLVCPRQLRPKQAYWAVVVPVFEHGRRAGLRLPLEGATNALAPAWANDGSEVTLPVYDRWRFVTGPAGDFESLARRLTPRHLPSTIGLRDMDVSRPGAGLPKAAPGPLGVEGALKALTTESTPWSGGERDAFVATIADLVNTPADVHEQGGPTIVAPPLRGRWHALQERLRPGEPPGWFQDLNADPRHRVAGGLGTQVVQAQQAPLLASAWEQAGEMRELNDRMRHAQLAREVAARLHARLFAGDNPEPSLRVTAPVHARLLASPKTVRAAVDESPAPPGLLGGSFRRVSRPTGAIAKRQARPARTASRLLERANRGELRAADVPRTPESLPTPEKVAAPLVPPGTTPDTPAQLRSRARILRIAAVVLGVVAVVLAVLGLWVALAVAVALAIAAAVAGAAASRRADAIERRLALATGNVSPDVIARAQPRSDWVPADPSLPAPPPSTDPETRARAVQAFRDAASALATSRDAKPAAGPTLRPTRLAALRDMVRDGLDPRITITKSIRDRMAFPSGFVWNPPDPLEPVIPGPEFPQPMYKPLAEISPEWILPGLEAIPPDTVAVAISNHAFIEAYMVGLNDEMSRELLWNEYPSSQRKTYFRQFWDTAGFVPPAGTPHDPETLKDIQPIHRWDAAAPLGAHGSRRAPDGGEHLVILFRGDLFLRYPRTIVRAVKARVVDGVRGLGDEELSHVLAGRINPDVAFFGFELTETAARGGNGDEGWFIVLEEQPSEPRFGLDAADGPATTTLSRWQDLSWGHLVPADGDPASIQYVDLDADLPKTDISTLLDARWHADSGIGPTGAVAADLAYITYQQPVRVAIHATDLLPPREP